MTRLLEVKHLKKAYRGGRVHAVDDVSFEIRKNETLGLLGASGCGKSTLAKLILKVMPADSGQIMYYGASLGAVFQDPYMSLDPKMTLREVLEEPFRIQGKKNAKFLDEKIKSLLRAVELPQGFALRRPHQLSGGECQRIAIARAISLEPELVICDEPVSSLDTSTQAQILDLLRRVQKQKAVSYLFISHNKRVVRAMSDRVLVMEDGKVLE